MSFAISDVSRKSERMRSAAKVMGWSNKELAIRLGTSDRFIRRLYSGNPEYEVPDILLRWLETLAAFVQANQPPAWREDCQ